MLAVGSGFAVVAAVSLLRSHLEVALRSANRPDLGSLQAVLATQDFRGDLWQRAAAGVDAEPLASPPAVDAKLDRVVEHLSTLELSAEELRLVGQWESLVQPWQTSQWLERSGNEHSPPQPLPGFAAPPRLTAEDVEAVGAMTRKVEALLRSRASLPTRVPASLSSGFPGRFGLGIGELTAWDILGWGGALLAFGLCLSTAGRRWREVARVNLLVRQGSTSQGTCVASAVWRRGEQFPEEGDALVEAARNYLRSSGSGRPPQVVSASRCELPESLADLAVRVAHELRNPLTSVKLLVQYAIQRRGTVCLDPQERSLLRQEVDRMEGTLRGLIEGPRNQHVAACGHDLRTHG